MVYKTVRVIASEGFPRFAASHSSTSELFQRVQPGESLMGLGKVPSFVQRHMVARLTLNLCAICLSE